VGGIDLRADVPVRRDSYCEVSFEAELPPARRGWRMARHQITVAEHTLRACNVVLPVPSTAGTGLIMVLPLLFTYSDDGVQRFPESALARRLTELLHALHDEYGAQQPIYYLAGVPVADRHR